MSNPLFFTPERKKCAAPGRSGGAGGVRGHPGCPAALNHDFLIPIPSPVKSHADPPNSWHPRHRADKAGQIHSDVQIEADMNEAGFTTEVAEGAEKNSEGRHPQIAQMTQIKTQRAYTRTFPSAQSASSADHPPQPSPPCLLCVLCASAPLRLILILSSNHQSPQRSSSSGSHGISGTGSGPCAEFHHLAGAVRYQVPPRKVFEVSSEHLPLTAGDASSETWRTSGGGGGQPVSPGPFNQRILMEADQPPS